MGSKKKRLATLESKVREIFEAETESDDDDDEETGAAAAVWPAVVAVAAPAARAHAPCEPRADVLQ